MLGFFRKNSATIFPLLFLFANTCSAEILLGTTLGGSHVQDDNYDNSNYGTLAAGYQVADLQFHLGYVYLGDFSLSDSDGKVESQGVFLEVAKKFKLNKFAIEPVIGIANISSTAYFSGRQVGESDDTTPMLKLRVTKDFSHFFGLLGGINYYSDVSGSDVTSIDFGVRFRID